MAITSREAQQIRSEAHAAGIDDATLEDWTSEAGAASRYALTSANATPPKAAAAAQIRARIQRHVQERETAVLAAAAEAAGVTPPPAPGTPMATERQIGFILTLLEGRRISGEGGGFFQGPRDRNGIAALTRDEASRYITSLKGEY